MKIRTIKWIADYAEDNYITMSDCDGYINPECAEEKWVKVDDLLEEMQNIIDKEKARCGEANAVQCWHNLKKALQLAEKR